ncbi:MAG: hypothetical protein PHR35_11935 [Kiritimatiellae bacterium]|nr:hypothetical protein [Kiritimatiellia bacterium]
MKHLLLLCVLCASARAFSAPVTYGDIIAARRAGLPAPALSEAETQRRIVYRTNDYILVECIAPDGVITTNRMVKHLIRNAREVSSNHVAQVAYGNAVARYARALAADDGAPDDGDSKAAAALLRQAARLERGAEKLEKKGGK